MSQPSRVTPGPAGPEVGAPGPVVRLQALSKTYRGGPPVLDGIDLAVAGGEFIAVIGPSGCGKTTLLRLLAGLETPTAGTVEVLGTTPDAARGDVGFIFQEPALLPWRTMRGNLELLLELQGQPPEVCRAAALEQAQRVGLAEALERFPCELSMGMRMRASVARSLTLSPRLLLLDEPFGALDELHRDQLDEALLRLQAEAGWAAFFVTHSVIEAVFLADRVLVLSANPGRIVGEIRVPFAHPREARLREDPRFLALVAETSATLRRVPR